MQTFLPYPDFERSARCLDPRRLGKQRVEVLQILNAILDPQKKGWKNHPCTNMWRGSEAALVRYGVAICDEWRRRGYADTVREKLLSLPVEASAEDPPWLGDERLHSNHRAHLLRKDPDYYGQFGWCEQPTTESYWPL
jgi:hypothetical protein